MEVKIWGDRGSIPVPGSGTVKYGGDTACIELRFDSARRFFLDAGTGIRNLGNQLLKERFTDNINLFISHTHWDHIIGFPFFAPIYLKQTKLNIYGPVHYEKKLKDVLAILMDYSYFPISAAQLSADVKYFDLHEETFNIQGVKITTKYLNHPVLNLGYRFEYQGKIFVYTGDHEKYYNVFGQGLDESELEDMDETVANQNESVIEFVKDADLLIADTTFTDDEYETHKGWGHSSVSQTIELSKSAGVKFTLFTHHAPEHSDDLLDKLSDKFCNSAFRFAVENNEYSF